MRKRNSMKRVRRYDSYTRMLIDRRAKQIAVKAYRRCNDGIIDAMRDKISKLIQKAANAVKNTKFKKNLLNIAQAVAAGNIRKAGVMMEKAKLAVKQNPAVVGGSAAAAAVGGLLTAAIALGNKMAKDPAFNGKVLEGAKKVGRGIGKAIAAPAVAGSKVAGKAIELAGKAKHKFPVNLLNRGEHE